MFRPPTRTTLSLVLSLWMLLAATCTAFNEEHCNACVAKGCGYCHRQSKTSSYHKDVCQCNHDVFAYGAMCNDISMISDGENYGKRKYYNNNYNNNNNNYNNNNNNYNNNNEAAQYYEEQQRYSADDDHYEANLSGEYTYQKANTHFQCRRETKPALWNGIITTGKVLGVVALVGFLVYVFWIHCPKPALRRKNPRKQHLMDDNDEAEPEIPPAIL